MNSKNGFTLIELIAAIAILAILSTLIVIGLDNMIDSKDSKVCNEYKKQVENAACVYVDSSAYSLNKDRCKSTSCSITIDELISAGLLSDDKDLPCDRNYTHVIVTWHDGVKTCTSVE